MTKRKISYCNTEVSYEGKMTSIDELPEQIHFYVSRSDNRNGRVPISWTSLAVGVRYRNIPNRGLEVFADRVKGEK
jgi:hypothetical protein